MSLLLIVVSSHFIVNNILEVGLFKAPLSCVLDGSLNLSAHIKGLIWFWQPVSLVIMNDIAAYVCGPYI